MEDKELEELSTGASVYFQGIMIGFVVLMIALIVLFADFRNFDLDSYCGLLSFFFGLLLFIWASLRYSDVYLSGNTIVTKKIIGTKTRSISDFKAIKQSMFPSAYYIEFQDGKKVYFSLSPSEIVKSLFGKDVIQNLTKKIEDRMVK